MPLDCSADLLIFSFDSCPTYRCTPVNRAALSSCMDPKRQTSQLVNRVISSVDFVSQTFCERASTSIKNPARALRIKRVGYHCKPLGLLWLWIFGLGETYFCPQCSAKVGPIEADPPRRRRVARTTSPTATEPLLFEVLDECKSEISVELCIYGAG
jgi:hypothetical protein